MFIVHLIDTHLLINDSRRLYFLLWKEEIYFNGSPNILKYLDRGGLEYIRYIWRSNFHVTATILQ